MKIAIFGGSFSPCHKEHVNVALGAIEHFNLDKLIICPAYIPPHKIGQKLESFEHRYNMLKLAFCNCEKVEISDFEAKSEGTSFSYLTIEHFSRLYPSSELYFLIGTDMLLDFPTWRNPDKILQLATLIVTRRDGDDFQSALQNYKKYFQKLPLVASYSGKNISSTKIRTYIQLGLDTSFALSEGVIEYINANSLYLGNAYYEYVKQALPKKRLKHTANVITLAIKLAKVLNLDIKKAEIAALLHDVAKYKDYKDYPNFDFSDQPKPVPEQIMHQFLGAYIAETELGIRDSEIINAIKYHTTGRIGMGDIEKVVFIADLIEEDREYSGVETIRAKIKEDFNNGFRYALKELVRFLKKDNESVYPLTILAEKHYNNKN